MTMTIKAIETEYAGCRFRSRLEARWAVFFDHIGVRWTYEPEGVDIDGLRYLPDFQLPDLDGLYVEVKGVMDGRGMEKILRLAATGAGVLVAGDVPRPDHDGPHFLLYGRIREAVARWFVSFFLYPDGDRTVMPFGWPGRNIDPGNAEHVEREAGLAKTIEGFGGIVRNTQQVADALTAARSARFDGRE